MNIILLGPPGVGKGTQALLISKKMNIPIISSSKILKKQKNKFIMRNSCDLKINKGDLIDDEIVINLVLSRIKKKDCQFGFILDGFPRTVVQAKKLTSFFIINIVFNFFTQDDILIKRTTGRRIHIASGRVFHIDFLPQSSKEIDTVTGEKLITRPDDKLEVVKKRLKIYKNKTTPVIDFYKEESNKKKCFFYEIDASKKICEIKSTLFKILQLKND